MVAFCVVVAVCVVGPHRAWRIFCRGLRLVWWRKRRGLFQLQLVMAADWLQRHACIMELGRIQPRREMVLHIAAALEVPLRHSNELPLAAGYVPVWAETDLVAQALAPIRHALD